MMTHPCYPKVIEESEYRIHFDQKLTQRLLHSLFLDLVFH